VEKWEFERILGGGGGGTVILQRRIYPAGTHELRAVKSIELPDGIKATYHESKRYLREVEALVTFTKCEVRRHKLSSSLILKCPTVEELLYTDTGDERIYIWMEYCENLDLGKHVKHNKPFSEEDAKDVALQVLTALEFMHKKGFAHRDMKPSVGATVDL
jgi:serine/threonine protein kinase